MNIKYYLESPVLFEKKVPLTHRTIAVFTNSKVDGSKEWLECYSVVDGHNEIKDSDYLLSCKEISKDDYINNTKGYYTPKEYIE